MTNHETHETQQIDPQVEAWVKMSDEEFNSKQRPSIMDILSSLTTAVMAIRCPGVFNYLWEFIQDGIYEIARRLMVDTMEGSFLKFAQRHHGYENRTPDANDRTLINQVARCLVQLAHWITIQITHENDERTNGKMTVWIDGWSSPRRALYIGYREEVFLQLTTHVDGCDRCESRVKFFKELGCEIGGQPCFPLGDRSFCCLSSRSGERWARFHLKKRIKFEEAELAQAIGERLGLSVTIRREC